MNFLEKLLNWLKGETKLSKQPIPTRNDPASAAREAARPKPGGTGPILDTTRNISQILSTLENVHIATMLNSITLSSDMKTLYLIDNGKAITYDLTVPEGVIIGLLGRQLVVATAVEAPTDTDTGRSGSDEVVKYTFKANVNSQYTLTYNDENQTLGIIGYDDLDTGIEAPDEHDCKEHRFEMKGNKLVRLLYKTDVLEIFHEEV